MPNFNRPRAGYRVPNGFYGPACMAIGDSLYNGMRSLTINADLARLSVPALVANAFSPRDEFRSPTYPEPVLFDVEKELHDIGFPVLAQLVGRLSALKSNVRSNALGWLQNEHQTADGVFFDNLSIAGAEVTHLIDESAGMLRQRLAEMKQVVTAQNNPFQWGKDDPKWGKNDQDPDKNWFLVHLHMAINGFFLLNPGNEPALDDMRPIDYVKLRQPRRLLVNIGANHGLITLTMNGDPDKGRETLNEFVDEAERLAEFLTDLDGTTRHIYFNKLLKPSAVPNLMPPYQRDGTLPALKDGYFPEYENILGGKDDYRVYTRAEMRDIDDFVREINEQVEARVRGVFGNDDRIHFFDTYAALEEFDGKHHPSRKIIVRDPDRLTLLKDDPAHTGRRYSNLALRVGYDIFPFTTKTTFHEGGFSSLDNHHPTTLGYRVFARRLCEFIEECEVNDVQSPVRVNDEDCTLLQNLPGAWFAIPWLYRAYRMERSPQAATRGEAEMPRDVKRPSRTNEAAARDIMDLVTKLPV